MNNYNYLFPPNDPNSRPSSPNLPTNNFTSGPLEPNGKNWKEILIEQRARSSPNLPTNNFTSGPLESNGKNWKEIRRARSAPKPTLRTLGQKFANNTKKKTLNRRNGSRNLLTRKQRKQKQRKQKP